jgi:hypothetical protein
MSKSSLSPASEQGHRPIANKPHWTGEQLPPRYCAAVGPHWQPVGTARFIWPGYSVRMFED